MSVLAWTTDKPTKPGWYWINCPKEGKAIVKIELSNYDRTPMFCDGRTPRAVQFWDSRDYKWAGPIPEPEG